MIFNRKQQKKSLIVTILCLLLITLAVAVTCTIYVVDLNKTMKNETGRMLREVSTHVSTMIRDRVKSSYEFLSSCAVTYNEFAGDVDVDITAINEKAMGYLIDKTMHSQFLRFAIASKDGMWITTDKDPATGDERTGTVYNNPQLEPLFEKAIHGKQCVSGKMKEVVGDGGDVVIYAVPIFKKGTDNVSGVLFGPSKDDKLGEYLSVESFGGEGYSVIIDQKGSIVVDSNNKNSFSHGDNFFQILSTSAKVGNGYDLTKVKNDIREGKAGTLVYTIDRIDKTVEYSPLGIENWYILSIVPLSVANGTIDAFIVGAVVINLIIVLAFIVMFVFFILNEQKNRQKLETIAFIDPVTGGLNRTGFEMEAFEKIRKAPGGTYVLVSIDVQKFKLINETFGSDSGDRTLKHVYMEIKKSLFEGELVSRIAADKFNVLIKNSSEEKIVERFDAFVTSTNSFNDFRSEKYFLYFAAGAYQILNPMMSIVLIQDFANAARKSISATSINSRCTCVFFSDRERQKVKRETDIDNKMENALEKGEFVVYLQPKYELRTNTIAGAEALVRWIDPDVGMIPPVEFISVFEKNGFIIKLDLYVFEQICILLERWVTEGLRPIPISVNMSRLHLSNPFFLVKYQEIFAKYHFPANLIEIELTETLVFENFEVLVDAINKIHQAGFTCSIDDFGSGYSSLNLLKDIPADTLKLDSAFFNEKNIVSDRNGYVIESVIELAKKLKMTTVSEGVELDEQVDFLRKAECDMIQGYVFSKPVSIDVFETMLHNETKGKNARKQK